MAKIARAQISDPKQQGLFESPADILTRVVVPGARVVRYRRTWRVGQTSGSDDFLIGRIGFEGERQTFIWDDDSKDFLPGPIPNGLVVPFVINIINFRVVFQVRPPEIKVNSFTGALEGILREATGQPWKVDPLTQRIRFDRWRPTVDKVTRMHFHVERPNPNWEGRPQLEDLMRRLGDLDAADFGFMAANGIATDDSLIAELVNHVERNYGRSTALGIREVDGHVIESVLDSDSGETEEIGSLAEVAPDDADLALLMGEVVEALPTEELDQDPPRIELDMAERAGESEAGV